MAPSSDSLFLGAMVAAGEELVKHGEQVLDAIEGVSGNAVVDDVMKIAEKAGITKDSVMEGIEKLDVNELLVGALAFSRYRCRFDDVLTERCALAIPFRTPLEMQCQMSQRERSCCLMRQILL